MIIFPPNCAGRAVMHLTSMALGRLQVLPNPGRTAVTTCPDGSPAMSEAEVKGKSAMGEVGCINRSPSELSESCMFDMRVQFPLTGT